VYENTYGGAESSNITADPHPRLQAYIAAARRGAKVRVLLDAYFDIQDLNSPRSNLRTVEYLTAVAQAEGLDLQAQRHNPTGQGIHNKMALAQIGGQGLGHRRQPERRRGVREAESRNGAARAVG
jgi:hypothetical protein